MLNTELFVKDTLAWGKNRRIKKFMRLIMFQFSFEKVESLRVSKSTSVFLTFFTKFPSICDTKSSLFTLSKKIQRVIERNKWKK